VPLMWRRLLTLVGLVLLLLGVAVFALVLGQSLERLGVSRERLAALERPDAEALLDEPRSRPQPEDPDRG